MYSPVSRAQSPPGLRPYFSKRVTVSRLRRNGRGGQCNRVLALKPKGRTKKRAGASRLRVGAQSVAWLRSFFEGTIYEFLPLTPRPAIRIPPAPVLGRTIVRLQTERSRPTGCALFL
jgi:hypothetical protein